jgi:hypothetical protein
MRRRVTLVLSSLLTVIALAVGGWLLDPAGSREPAGTAVESARPQQSGPAFYAAVTRRMTEAGTATYTFSGTSGGGEVRSGSGTMRFQADEPGATSFDASVLLRSPSTGVQRAVLLPGSAYLALPRAKGIPKDKPWLKVSQAPTSRLGKQLEPVADQVRAAFDPGQSLGLLRAARVVEEIGPDPVEGRPATLHRTSVRLRTAARLTTDTGLRGQFRAMLTAGVRTLRMQVWVDPTGLPLRLQADVPAAPGVFSVTGVFRAWGKPVRVVAPSSKQILDADRVEADRLAAIRKTKALKAKQRKTGGR